MDDKVLLKNMAVSFLANLFSTNPKASRDFIRARFLPLKGRVRQRMEESYAVEEVCKALKQMASLKALGSDDYRALFFMQTWSKTCPSLSNFV